MTGYSLLTRSSKRQVALGVVLGLAILIGITSPVARAADGTDSIAISPGMQRIEAKAGVAETGKFTVINDGATPYSFIVYSRPYSVTNENYDAQFEKTSKNTDLYQWVKFAEVSYRLAPGERVEIQYDLHVPATAAPGGHYGVIFAETQPEPGQEASVLRKKRVGSIVLANVDGKVSREGKALSSTAPFWQTSPPLTASNRVENSGNTDFQANVLTKVTDVFGSVKYSEQKDYVVYPGTIRNIMFSWTNAPWFGLFKVNQTVTVLDTPTSTTHFVLLAPRWLALVVIILLIVGAGYGLLQRKRR
ncbi:MAG TPA: hypothetical protein VF281_04540 [Candidatus Saccharimonadales bacterium]